jgi:hypothetical protein
LNKKIKIIHIILLNILIVALGIYLFSEYYSFYEYLEKFFGYGLFESMLLSIIVSFYGYKKDNLTDGSIIDRTHLALVIYFMLDVFLMLVTLNLIYYPKTIIYIYNGFEGTLNGKQVNIKKKNYELKLGKTTFSINGKKYKDGGFYIIKPKNRCLELKENATLPINMPTDNEIDFRVKGYYANLNYGKDYIDKEVTKISNSVYIKINSYPDNKKDLEKYDYWNLDDIKCLDKK